MVYVNEMEEIEMKVAIASDHGGVNIREELKNLLTEMNIEFEDFGCECARALTILITLYR